MKQRRSTPLLALTWLVIVALACNLSGGGGGLPEATAAFQTVQAILTATGGAPIAAAPSDTPQPGAPPSNTPAPGQPSDTPAPKPTDTPGPTNTLGAQGCVDGSQFVSDVTIPDNAVLNPGQAFTKTWRIRNNGTCSWNSSYSWVFIAGDAMGGPASVPISGNVPPNSTYDVSVNLTAPTTPGTYKGTWQMRNSANALFGTKPYVQIVVAAPTATLTNTPSPVTATFTPSPTFTNTPIPINFTAGYAGSWACGAIGRISFQIINIGSVNLESMNYIVQGPIGTQLNSATQNTPFKAAPAEPEPACTQAGAEALAPAGASWVHLVVNPVPAGGTSGRAIIKICSQNDLGGGCKEVTVDFTY